MTNSVTITGNLTADPELRHTPSGQAVVNFTIADTPRTFDRAANEWKDGETVFLRCAVWREAAENVAASLAKGMRVTATGKLKANTFETKTGETRTGIELDVDEIGPALKYATAKVTRTPGGQGGQGGGQGGFGGGQRSGGGQSGSWGGNTAAAAQDDPWAAPGASNAGGGWGNGTGY